MMVHPYQPTSTTRYKKESHLIESTKDNTLMTSAIKSKEEEQSEKEDSREKHKNQEEKKFKDSLKKGKEQEEELEKKEELKNRNMSQLNESTFHLSTEDFLNLLKK